MELGEHVGKLLLEPENAGNYALLANISAAGGRWDDLANVRGMMKDAGVKRVPVCSWIKVKNRVHLFLIGDRSHPQFAEIYAMLENLSRQMEMAGYVPDMNFVFYDVDEEKEHLLCTHNENLAIAFGLMNTSSGTLIRISKNPHTRENCHNATKFISKIVE